MKVFLDGTTGYLGSAIAKELVAAGHDVLGHVRTPEAASRAAALGVTPQLGNLLDPSWLRNILGDVDVAIHAASPNDAGSAGFDNAILDVVLDAFQETGQRYVHTGGSWIHGSGAHIDEQSPFDPPTMVAWRPAVLERIRQAAPQVRATMVAPANLYGHSGGLVALLAHGPVEDGHLLYPGATQAFANVHVDDAAALFVRVLEHPRAPTYVLAANPEAVPMDTLMRALSQQRGLGEQIHGETPEAATERLGLLAEPLLLDATVVPTTAQALGWTINGPTLLENVRAGSYVSNL